VGCLSLGCANHSASEAEIGPEVVDCDDVRLGDCLFRDIGRDCRDDGTLAVDVTNVTIGGSDCTGSFHLTCADGCIASVRELPPDAASSSVDPADLAGRWEGRTEGGQQVTWEVCNGEVLFFTAPIEVSFAIGAESHHCPGETSQTASAPIADGAASFTVSVPNALLEVAVEIDFASAESATGSIPATTNTGFVCLDPAEMVMSTSESDVTRDIAFSATRSGPSELAICDGACVDLPTDREHCGDCDHACPTGEACIDGTCACPDGGQNCDGVCVDLDSDPENCGDCDHACHPRNELCSGGFCHCLSGGYSCDGACVDFNSDPENCGGCGSACEAGQRCVGGACE